MPIAIRMNMYCGRSITLSPSLSKYALSRVCTRDTEAAFTDREGGNGLRKIGGREGGGPGSDVKHGKKNDKIAAELIGRRREVNVISLMQPRCGDKLLRNSVERTLQE